MTSAHAELPGVQTAFVLSPVLSLSKDGRSYVGDLKHVLSEVEGVAPTRFADA